MAQQRVKIVSQRFRELTGRDPSRVCLAPGRVNIIGEHIDYNGFGVLPCAVARFTVLAIGISPNDETKALSVASVDSTASSFELALDSVVSVPLGAHQWYNYVLGAYLGLSEFGVKLPRGIQIVVGGDLPRACGLSSSSSLVVAAVMSLASLRLTRQHISPEMMAEICMKAEWHVGTAGGGMDQAAIILSKPHFASHIEFNPVRSTPVQLPAGISFVVANSLARSAKAETAHTQYNKRVFECKIGLRILRTTPALSLPGTDMLTDTYSSMRSDLKNPTIETLTHMCKTSIPSGDLRKEDIISLIGQPALDLLLTGRWGRSVWDLNETFLIQSRAIHVLSEAHRVESFIAAANANDTQSMANLINASGESLDKDYDCSCPELRALVKVMRDAGCSAARLVGAGWGGCCVGMVDTDKVEETISKIKEEYFVNQLGLKVDEVDLDAMCFAFEPSGGASFVDE